MEIETDPIQENRQVLDYLMRRATTDMNFRRALLSDPKSALEEELGLEMAATFGIRFVENAGADLTVVLPDPAVEEDHLLDKDLDYVAGGRQQTELPDAMSEWLTRVRRSAARIAT